MAFHNQPHWSQTFCDLNKFIFPGATSAGSHNRLLSTVSSRLFEQPQFPQRLPARLVSRPLPGELHCDALGAERGGGLPAVFRGRCSRHRFVRRDDAAAVVGVAAGSRGRGRRRSSGAPRRSVRRAVQPACGVKGSALSAEAVELGGLRRLGSGG